MWWHRRTIRERGATLVEVLVAIGLTGIMLPALLAALVAAHAGRPTSIQSLQASALLREGTEAVRNVREKGWSNVATDGTYHPVVSSGTWTLVSGSETINGFTRQIVISTVQRSNIAGTGDIVASGGTNDPSTKHVVVTVSWTKPVATSLSTDTYLTRWQSNAVWSQTTQSDFSAGTSTNTCTTSSCDNASPPSNTVQLQDYLPTWQLPSVYGTGYNLTGNTAGNDIYVATISGTPYAFLGYAAGLAIINISNPAAPTLAGTLSIPAGVNGVMVVGTVAYLATNTTNGQLTTVNVANPAAPAILKAFQIQDTNNVGAMAVYVSGTTAVVVKKQVGKALLFNTYGEINTVNVSNPSNPTLSDTLNVGANCTNVWVNGNYAYVADSVNNKQLTIVNITTPTNISSAATVNVGANANSVVVNGTKIYIAINNLNGTGKGELLSYTLSSPTSLTGGTSYEISANATGLSLDPANPDYLAVGTQGANKQLIILNVSAATPTLVNNIALGGNGNTVKIFGSFAYVGTSDTAKEMTVVYAGYRPSGTFESSTFDAGANAAFNYFNFSTNIPSGSTLQLQVAANNTNSGWSYVGPDGTSGTYYTAPGSIPLSITSNRYFRYKAYFTPTANGQQTPALNDVELNYSP